MDKEAVFSQLKWSLQAMACDGETQISLFPDFVVVSDEIVNDFHHWRQTVESNYKSEFSSGQIESLRKIDDTIDKITKGDEEIWDNESLRTHGLWEELRRLGGNALSEFKWDKEVPPTNRSTFVKG
jgi:hypothetical protein